MIAGQEVHRRSNRDRLSPRRACGRNELLRRVVYGERVVVNESQSSRAFNVLATEAIEIIEGVRAS